MRKCVERVAKQAPKSAARYRQQLIERIQSAGLPAPAADDERLLKEIVYFADRSDITEELTRLQSHFQQFDDCRKSKEPVGRTLDFLAQEMNREINTIGVQGERRVDFARGGDAEGGTGKVSRTGPERRISDE